MKAHARVGVVEQPLATGRFEHTRTFLVLPVSRDALRSACLIPFLKHWGQGTREFDEQLRCPVPFTRRPLTCGSVEYLYSIFCGFGDNNVPWVEFV